MGFFSCCCYGSKPVVPDSSSSEIAAELAEEEIQSSGSCDFKEEESDYSETLHELKSITEGYSESYSSETDRVLIAAQKVALGVFHSLGQSWAVSGKETIESLLTMA